MKKYVGHSAGGVGCVDYTLGDKYVLSVGIDDRLLLQWKVRTNMHWILRKEMHAWTLQHFCMNVRVRVIIYVNCIVILTIINW